MPPDAPRRVLPGVLTRREQVTQHDEAMTVFVLDTMIFDKIIEAELVDRTCELVELGGLELLVTHIQEKQLTEAARRKPEKFARLDEIPRTKVVTAGAIWGLSVWGGATWTSDADAKIIETVQGQSKQNSEDALIASTAKSRNAPLVTEDGHLASKARAGGVDVWNWTQFKQRLGRL